MGPQHAGWCPISNKQKLDVRPPSKTHLPAHSSPDFMIKSSAVINVSDGSERDN